MTGALELLEDPRGFWRRFSFLPLPFMLGELGRAWVLDTLTVKTFPGCHYFQTALTALERLRRRAGPLSPERVRAVRVETTKLACEATRFAREAGGSAASEALRFAHRVDQNEHRPLRSPRAASRGPRICGWFDSAHHERGARFNQPSQRDRDEPFSSSDRPGPQPSGGDGHRAGLTPVSVSFDLAQSAAVLLAAGRLGPEELNQRWLDDHREALRDWLGRIRVTHDPALTAKVLAGARALAWGDRALEALTARQVLRLRRRYAEEYQSSLLDWADLLAGVRGALKRDEPREPGGDGVALYFPARVTVELTGGGEVSERVDLPPGSLAAPHFEQELKAKVLRELPRAAWDAGLTMEEQDLDALVAAFCAPRE